MTPKEITTLAGHRLVPPWVMKLSLDVAAAQREACAKVCMKQHYDFRTRQDFAAAIRARGNK